MDKHATWMVCPVCGYTIPTYFSTSDPGHPYGFAVFAVDENEDIAAFCPQCFYKKLRALDVPQLKVKK